MHYLFPRLPVLKVRLSAHLVHSFTRRIRTTLLLFHKILPLRVQRQANIEYSYKYRQPFYFCKPRQVNLCVTFGQSSDQGSNLSKLIDDEAPCEFLDM